MSRGKRIQDFRIASGNRDQAVINAVDRLGHKAFFIQAPQTVTAVVEEASRIEFMMTPIKLAMIRTSVEGIPTFRISRI